MIIYKYFPPEEYVYNSLLEKSVIRFSQPEIFNDPFESFPSFAEDKAEKVEFAKADFQKNFGRDIPPDSLERALRPFYDALEQMPKTLGESIVSLCLTKRNNNSLMWSHYAASHQGLVLGFDAASTFFQPDNGKAKQGLLEIKYSQDRPTSNSTGPIADVDTELEKYFFTKSVDWQYEEELRICASTSGAIPNQPPGMYLFEFPTECLQEIIFGLRMSEVNISRVMKIVKKRYPSIRLFQARLNESSFNLDVIPY